MAKMTEQEKHDWDELYEYVKIEILNYDDNMKLPKSLILRILGLKDGKFMANKKTKALASYPFSTILMTFKVNKIAILNAFKNDRSFKDENHKINYMMVIIENNINDVVNKINRIDRSKEQGESVNITINTVKADYTPKTKEVKNDLLNDLW
jgi:hypothetical protein